MIFFKYWYIVISSKLNSNFINILKKKKYNKCDETLWFGKNASYQFIDFQVLLFPKLAETNLKTKRDIFVSFYRWWKNLRSQLGSHMVVRYENFA